MIGGTTRGFRFNYDATDRGAHRDVTEDALGAVFMSASTVIVAINARMLKLKQPPT